MTVLLQIAVVACGIAAFIGGYVLIHPSGGSGLVGINAAAVEGSGLRALGGALLLGHAAALAALAQAPAVGSCIAAGLGSAWLGAGAGRALSAILGRTGRSPQALLRIGFEAAMGVALWSPLWAYLTLLRQAGRHGFG